MNYVSTNENNRHRYDKSKDIVSICLLPFRWYCSVHKYYKDLHNSVFYIRYLELFFIVRSYKFHCNE